ncbi:NUDIX hydrolase [Halosquirtibacter xylanolyticus]|uniref:NUDIX domain-containing protein n=1 Tax=Halosquirtibacter xylanolyticus TaxID=3374599 RepID=UPI003748D523|nr:NUDIX hydrolase [Prolixibacteraceae bacterium]
MMSDNKKSPFQIISQTEIYRNPWISLREDQCVREDGGECIFGVTRVIDGIAVLAIDHNRDVHLVHEFKYAIQRRSIEVVCGGMDTSDPSPEFAAQRELKEELGIIASKWSYHGAIDPFTSVIDSRVHLFVAEELQFGETNREETEDIEAVSYPFDEAYKLIEEGVITHAPTILLLQKIKILNNL